MSWYTFQNEKLILNLLVQPGAKRTEIVGLHEGRLKVRIHAPPQEGRANEALVKWIAKVFEVPLRQVLIHQGLHSKRKVIVVSHSTVSPEVLLQQ
jgi:uncharacterized protein